MKKFALAALCALTVCAVSAAEQTKFTASGAAKAEEIAPGVVRLTIQPGKGWPQVRFPAPAGAWKGSKVSFSVKQVEPADTFPGGLTVGSNSPREALKAVYIHNKLKAGEAVPFQFECLGDKAPAEIYVAGKNPTAPAVLEITVPVFAAPAAQK